MKHILVAMLLTCILATCGSCGKKDEPTPESIYQAYAQQMQAQYFAKFSCVVVTLPELMGLCGRVVSKAGHTYYTQTIRGDMWISAENLRPCASTDYYCF